MGIHVPQASVNRSCVLDRNLLNWVVRQKALGQDAKSAGNVEDNATRLKSTAAAGLKDTFGYWLQAAKDIEAGVCVIRNGLQGTTPKVGMTRTRRSTTP
jgi:hypothetical protein